MCGITGFVDFSSQINDIELESATGAIRHRGPDSGNTVIWSSNNYRVGFGHRRLSIIDLSTAANQPLVSVDGSLAIVFNGEIYNYREIKSTLESIGYVFTTSSDTEVILNAYQCWGVQCLNKFVGMFAFAIYDRRQQQVFLARDRVGVKPLYIYKGSSTFIFGSELKSLRAFSAVNCNMNLEAAISYLNYGYVSGPFTIYENVEKLLPGHYGILDLLTGYFTSHSYWNVLSGYLDVPLEDDYNQAKEKLHELLKSACLYRMVADVPVGVFLSGGYDSSLVTAILAKHSGRKINTFSIGFEEEQYNEANHAAAVARFIGTNHNEYICSKKEAQEIIPSIPFYYDEPFGDSSCIPTILVSRLARQQVTVALSADGGDEIFGGYNKYSNALFSQRIKNRVPRVLYPIAASILQKIPVDLISAIRKRATNRDVLRKFSLVFSKDLDAIQFMDVISRASSNDSMMQRLLGAARSSSILETTGRRQIVHLDVINQMLAIDFQTYLVDDILTKVDRATMSVSLEGREPLLDHRIIEYVSRLPSKFKIRGLEKKYILKDIAHNYIPRNIMERPKMGFGVPVNDWMRQELKPLFNDYLSASAISKMPFLNGGEVQRMLNRYYRGDDSDFTLLWYLFNLSMWHEKWK